VAFWQFFGSATVGWLFNRQVHIGLCLLPSLNFIDSDLTRNDLFLLFVCSSKMLVGVSMNVLAVRFTVVP
jgi:hypothetical protein